MRALLVAEGGRMDRLPTMIEDLDLVVSGRSLSRLGFRYVVVHGGMYPPEKLEQSLELLAAALGPETWADGNTHVWQLEPPEKEP
jgi:predicted phosphodiesterase